MTGMTENCERCGEPVSKQFARVFGDQDNNVHRCLGCLHDKDGRKILRRGGGAMPERDIGETI